MSGAQATKWRRAGSGGKDGTMRGWRGRGGERELRPCQERGGGAPADVRIPSGQAVKALRVKPDLPPSFLTAFTKGGENPPEMLLQPPPPGTTVPSRRRSPAPTLEISLIFPHSVKIFGPELPFLCGPPPPISTTRTPRWAV